MNFVPAGIQALATGTTCQLKQSSDVQNIICLSILFDSFVPGNKISIYRYSSNNVLKHCVCIIYHVYKIKLVLYSLRTFCSSSCYNMHLWPIVLLITCYLFVFYSISL